LYAGLILLAFFGFSRRSSGFVPIQDKQYLVGFAQLLTEGSTEAVIRQMSDIALSIPV